MSIISGSATQLAHNSEYTNMATSAPQPCPDFLSAAIDAAKAAHTSTREAAKAHRAQGVRLPHADSPLVAARKAAAQSLVAAGFGPAPVTTHYSEHRGHTGDGIRCHGSITVYARGDERVTLEGGWDSNGARDVWETVSVEMGPFRVSTGRLPY